MIETLVVEQEGSKYCNFYKSKNFIAEFRFFLFSILILTEANSPFSHQNLFPLKSDNLKFWELTLIVGLFSERLGVTNPISVVVADFHCEHVRSQGESRGVLKAILLYQLIIFHSNSSV